MTLIGKKIPQYDLDTKGIVNIRENQVIGRAEWIKAKFDELVRLIIQNYNPLIDSLVDPSAAEYLGANIAGITANTLAGVLTILKGNIDNRYTKDEINKLLNALTGASFTNVKFDEQSGMLILIKSDGTEIPIDLALYQGGFTMSINHETQEMVFKFADGREERVDLQRFLVPEEFIDTYTIEWDIANTEGQEFRANIRQGSIGLSELSGEVTAGLGEYVSEAQGYAINAEKDANNAAQCANNACNYAASAALSASSALESERNAKDSELNSKNSEDIATLQANRAKSEADRASAVAGGDFITPLDLDAHNADAKSHECITQSVAQLEIRITETFKMLIDTICPVGEIKLTAKNVNPGTYIPDTTWIPWGTGCVPVGVDTSQTEFNTVEKTGGAKTHTLTIAELAEHRHPMSQAYAYASGGIPAATAGFTAMADSSGPAGGGQPHNNLQPYITCYMWKRTA